MPTTFTPLERPDARHLYGFASPGGIIWRDSSREGRRRWSEREGEQIIASERIHARRSLEADQAAAEAMRRGAPEKRK